MPAVPIAEPSLQLASVAIPSGIGRRGRSERSLLHRKLMTLLAAGESIPASAVSLEHLARPVALFRLLADPIRLRMLFHMVRLRECNVASLCREFHRSQPAISYHLALLREAGLVDLRREGQSSYYRVVSEEIEKTLGPFIGNLMHGRRQARFDDYLLEHQPQTSARRPCAET